MKDASVIDWLLDADPAIRWQVMRDIASEPAQVYEAERSRIAEEGWGARLLSLREEDGQWMGGACFPKYKPTHPGQPWTATYPTLSLLRLFGIRPDHPRMRETVALVRENSKWEHDGQRFFDGEVEPCINGQTVAIGTYFGEDMTGTVDRLLDEQMEDRGWNCDQEVGSTRGSFHSTICVLEGLLEYESVRGPSPALTQTRESGQEYLMDRGMLRSLSTGEIPDNNWTRFSFPNWWYYDVLRGLDYLRQAGLRPDRRLDEAIGMVEAKRGADGRWSMDLCHPGDMHFAMEEGEGLPSRWITLRAMRVLDWAGS